MIAPSTRKSATQRGSCGRVGQSNSSFAIGSTTLRPGRAKEILCAEAFGGRDLDDRLLAVVVFHPERPGDHRMHGIERGDVGELEDLLVGSEGLELDEQLDRRSPVALGGVEGGDHVVCDLGPRNLAQDGHGDTPGSGRQANLRNSATRAESKYSSRRVIFPSFTAQTMQAGSASRSPSCLRFPRSTCCWTKPFGNTSTRRLSYTRSSMRVTMPVRVLRLSSGPWIASSVLCQISASGA